VGLICVDGTPGLKVDGVVGPATAAALRLEVTLPMFGLSPTGGSPEPAQFASRCASSYRSAADTSAPGSSWTGESGPNSRGPPREPRGLALIGAEI
jgi:hypothetical protein